MFYFDAVLFTLACCSTVVSWMLHVSPEFDVTGVDVCRYVDGEQYFSDVAEALQSAEEQIFITDWWLTPELFLKRPILNMTDESRLDLILRKKAVRYANLACHATTHDLSIL